jgi:hypothetical protein
MKISSAVISNNRGSKLVSDVRSFIDLNLYNQPLSAIEMFSTNYYGDLTPPYTYEATGANFIRSTTYWASELNEQLTSVSVFAGNPIADGGKAPNRQRFTLITPRHALAARHYIDGASGNTLSSGAVNTYSASQRVWIDTNNNPISAAATHFGGVSGSSDGLVLVLDREMPLSINRMPIASADLYNRFWSGDLNFGVPLISTDQYDQLSVREISKFSYPTNVTSNIAFQIPSSSLRNSFYRTAISGDSSNPIMIVYNNVVSIISTYLGGGSGSGPALFLSESQINAAIVAADAAAGISTGYTVTVANID